MKIETIKIILNLKTPFITPLHSDTIFGHFAWGLRYLYGEDILKDMLRDFKEKPFIVFSNGFDYGMLPKPFLEPYLLPPNSMDLNKKFKKKSFIKEEWIYENIDGLNEKIIFEKFLKEEYDECLSNPCEQCNKNNEDKKN